MKIFEDITNRIQSGNNIKHLTLNTKHKTLDTNTQVSHNEASDTGLADASGLASLSASQDIPSQVRVICSGVGNLPLENPQFQYIAVSLKTQTKEQRLEVNVDFKLQNSTAFNKLVFNLVCWDRRREFFENIKDIQDWHGYQTAYNQQTKTDFIGKGRPRQKQLKGKAQHRSPLREETAMMVNTEGPLICHLWIEDAYFILPLDPWSDPKKIFCAKAEYVNNPGSTRIKRGGWL